MRLLFDHHLSHKLVRRLADLFPGSTQTRLLGLERADDPIIWNHAKTHGFVIVTLDADFSDLSVLRGHPPKVVWLRCGNSTVARVEQLLRANAGRMIAFAADPTRLALRFGPSRRQQSKLAVAAIVGVGFEQDRVGLARIGTELLALGADGVLGGAGEMGDLPVGKSERLGLGEFFCVE